VLESLIMNKEVFKAYDIRGVYPQEINEETAYLAARAFFVFLEGGKVVVGRDGRNSSPGIFEAVCKGIIDSGGSVINIGITNTPLLNFSVANKRYKGGVMITASHNPPEFNGMKLIKENALQVYGEDIQKIRRIAEKGDFLKGKGEMIPFDPLPEYLEHMESFCDNLDGLKVVVDCANGVAGISAVPFLSNTHAEVVFMNEKVDGDFPNYQANPQNPENMKALQERVLQERAHVGIFFDGDGDRSVMVNQKGELVSMDTLLILLAQEELSGKPNEKIYYDLRFSRLVKEKIKEHGGVPVMMRVGNPFYKEKLFIEGGAMGAELSGHVMFKDNYCIDDGLFAFVKTANLLKKGELLEKEGGYFQSDEISLEVESKEDVLKRVKEFYKKGRPLDIDGVYIEFDKWWFSLRESNTENLVRLRLEADTKDLLEEKKKELTDLIVL